MSDVTLTLATQTPVTLAQSATTVALALTDATAVTLASSPVSVALALTDATPVTLALGCFDMGAWINSLNVCDSDNADSGTGNSAEDAGVAIGGFYLTAFNHESTPGGVIKKRLV